MGVWTWTSMTDLTSQTHSEDLSVAQKMPECKTKREEENEMAWIASEAGVSTDVTGDKTKRPYF